MFAKLLKHELKSYSRLLGGLSIAALGAGALGGLLMWAMISQSLETEQDSLRPELMALGSTVVLGFIVIALIAYLFVGYYLPVYKFYKNKFTDEGYLTFTLPVSTHSILLSHMVSRLIWMAIVFVTYIASFILIIMPAFAMAVQAVGSDVFFQDMPHAFEELKYLFPNAFEYILTFIGGTAYSLVLPMISITIGALVAKKHKILAAIGIGYGISVAVSTLTSILTISDMFTDALLYQNMDAVFSSSMTIPALTQLMIAVGGYFLMHYLITKKLNLP